MKIIRDNKVYVQAKDVAVLANSNMDVPQEVVFAIFKDYNHTSESRMKNLERYLCFEDEEAIRFFKNQDWIVDYDLVKDKNDDACLLLLRECLDKKREVFDGIANIRNEKTEAIVFDSLKFLDHKYDQLKSIAALKINHQELPLPSDLQPKKRFGKKINGFVKRKK